MVIACSYNRTEYLEFIVHIKTVNTQIEIGIKIKVPLLHKITEHVLNDDVFRLHSSMYVLVVLMNMSVYLVSCE